MQKSLLEICGASVSLLWTVDGLQQMVLVALIGPEVTLSFCKDFLFCQHFICKSFLRLPRASFLLEKPLVEIFGAGGNGGGANWTGSDTSQS